MNRIGIYLKDLKERIRTIVVVFSFFLKGGREREREREIEREREGETGRGREI